MKFGIVLPTYLYAPERSTIARRSYESLAQSQVPDNRPVPTFVVAPDHTSTALFLKYADASWIQPVICMQPAEVHGPDAAVAWVVEKFFAETDCTHVVELADDIFYHPLWLSELEALVYRHPSAIAWSVYRSAHTRHHRTIRQDPVGDHLVTSMAGNGTCWTREEHVAWGVKWQHGPRWPLPDGNGDTLDLYHAYARPGERWATDKTYMQHLGVAVGLHTRAGVPEFSLNFAGEL